MNLNFFLQLFGLVFKNIPVFIDDLFLFQTGQLVQAQIQNGLGLFFGGKIHTALGRDTFVRLISVLLLGSGTALLMKA